MDVLLSVAYAVILLSFLVFIHEGGHYLAARLFKVRVTEFMLGLPGPNIGFTKGGTKFGITPFLLGGYARVCGMEQGEMSPHLENALASVYRRGTAHMEEVAADLGISNDEAIEALDELVEWGSLIGPKKTDEYNTYRTPKTFPTKKERKEGIVSLAEGTPREFDDAHALFESEYSQQYRSLPVWKRSIILVAGVAINLLFAMIVFVILYSVIGFDVQNTNTGEITHVLLSPLKSIMAGFMYMGMVVQAVLSLFNPATAAQTVSDSTSIVGIAVLSKTAAEQGFISFLSFTAMISVSLGVVNLVPIPPLDGGRLVVEWIQKIIGRTIPVKVMNAITLAAIVLFVVFFAIMLNQDIQRFVFGNWG